MSRFPSGTAGVNGGGDAVAGSNGGSGGGDSGGLATVAAQIERLTREAVGVKAHPLPAVLKIEGEQDRSYGLVGQNGVVEWFDAEVEPRKNDATTVFDLADQVRHFVAPFGSVFSMPLDGKGNPPPAAPEGIEGELADVSREPFCGPAEAYVRITAACKPARKGDVRCLEERIVEDASAALAVVAVLDAHRNQPYGEGRRENRVYLRVPELRVLRAMAFLETQRPWMSHADTIEFIRSEMGLGAHAFVRTIRTVKMKTNSDGTSSIEHQEGSLRVSALETIESEFGPIPEEVEFIFPVVPELIISGSPDDGGGPDGKAAVVCTVSIDKKRACFRLVPKPGEVEAAVRRAEQFIARQLQLRANESPDRPDRLRVFCGQG